MYTDYLLMTAHKGIVKDIEEVFNFIDKPYRPAKFNELLVSPNEMKNKLIQMIDTEIKNKRKGKPAYIMAKLNHVTDWAIVKKLYDASSEGVRIDLVVRGNCSMVTGIEGVSENKRIVRILDRYLEHASILLLSNVV